MLNLGGIANITALDAKGNIIAAFDTGPANTLIDLICREAFNEPYDKDGNYARSGKVNDLYSTPCSLTSTLLLHIQNPQVESSLMPSF